MEKYRIRVDYQTGDSFGNEDTIGYLELSWENLDIAKENLKAIKEHHEMYKAIENPPWDKRKQDRKEVLKEYEDRWWFVNKPEHYSEDMIHHLMYLKADNGNLMQQWNFWCGYFETLYGAEIENVDSDLSFNLR